MPELPEVESTRRHLEPELVGRAIEGVHVARARMLRRQPRPADFADRLRDRRVVRLGRLGKFLLADLSGDITWVTHLGMSGRVSLVPRTEPEPAHTNVAVDLDSGAQFRLVDPRTFGFVAAYTPEELATSPLGRLGPDALSELPTPAGLEEALAGRTAPLKAILLDQTVIAGLGNIYADEALNRAGISPHRPAGSLTRRELVRLQRAIEVTLAAGLRHGGTSLGDMAYLLPDGRAGEYLRRLRAYGREGDPCRRCRSPIVREVLRQRSTYWCPQCQH